jgi:tetratricopeptide (TPR) repeat protein
MIISRFQLGLALTAVCAIAAGLVWSVRKNAQLRSDAARQSAAAATRTAELQQEVTTQSQRVAVAEAKVAELLKSVSNAEKARGMDQIAARAETDTQDLLKAAMARATQLIKEGKFQEALEEYLKSYRELEAKHPGSSECQSLMGAIEYLGRRYPAALVALGDLRDSAMKQHEAHPDNHELVFEIALLNERVGEGRRTLALYDSLPPNDIERQTLASIANASFVEAQRYADALLGKPFGRMLSLVEVGSQQIAKQTDSLQAELRKSVINGTVTNIEVLTGAGKLEDARMLTEKLLAFDASDSTRTAIKEHLERAGAPPVR